jgi:bacterioferritin
MQAKPGIIDALNTVLTLELTAVNRYFLQAEMMANWGYHRLHEKIRQLSLSEMEDAESLIKHILYLEGMPNVQRLNQVQIGESAVENLTLDLAEEKLVVSTLADLIVHSANVQDFTTRGMFEAMIKEEEEHVDWFETQLETISQIGAENYLTEQLH